MYEVDVVEDHDHLSVDPALLTQVLNNALEQEGVREAVVTVVLSDHATVRDLNRVHLNHDFDTDVLAFDLSEEGSDSLDGEIYVDLDTAHERYHEFGTTFNHEAIRYALHGLLHLIGYRDKGDADREEMRTLEDLYLANL
ncbi:MAG: rRNA maturation RNase YbeY [Rhodothermales bacterium]